MPTRLCLHSQCPSPATYRGRCAQHSRQREHQTHPNRHIYNTARWKHTRTKVLYEQPLCPCGQIATDVDHIVAIQDGGDQWARHNLQALCPHCHAVKTNHEIRTR